jgi:hypothetical protein
MAISAQVNLTFKLEEESYTVNLNIPSSAPTAKHPFNFKVVNNVSNSDEGDSDEGNSDNKIELLSVAIGAKDQVYVAVSPPKKLLEDAAGDLIENLDVVVQEGKYDRENNVFTSNTDGDKKDGDE